ncbi:class F sortase [Cellulosimicrobium marinum]|uniref:class F sortase n=1 Tax=Cellulosimicrobium marinum TaxID=1638992 RepID=UPI001E523AE1|nr:class F sortase [Cellulosimicrobium marinum]MCB7136929.1 class F sortase [Cellulosimicrobium marinum]
MSHDVRRGVVPAVAVALLLGGGAAVAVGVAGQEPAPPQVRTTSGAAPTPDPSTPPPDRGDGAAAPVRPGPTPTAPAEQPPPTRVRVPAIGVDSALVTLGLQDDGTMAVPQGEDVDRAAWFDGSPRPGADGPAVIEGHVDTENGPSVFHDLARLSPGDEVTVDRADGSSVTFVVETVEQFRKDEFPTATVYGNTPGPELRLITCGGTVDPATGHYTDNTVISARLA